MKFDPTTIEQYRANTKANTSHYSAIRTKVCSMCKKCRSLAQYKSEKSKICNKCKGVKNV